MSVHTAGVKRLKVKTGGSKLLLQTGWSGGRGYLKRGTRRKDERFENVRVECSILKLVETRVVYFNESSLFYF
jgi:hypothetical protein